MQAPRPPEPIPVRCVLLGRARPYTRPGSMSAIHKAPTEAEVHVGPEGLVGDEQGDRRVHGGPDKAIHHYPFDHYARWSEELGPLPALELPGAFGENLSTIGLTEQNVCVADRFSLGTAVVEVSQVRQPCWKLADRFDVRDMPARVQSTGRPGWYYRVVTPGRLRVGDAMTLLERPWPDWSLARMTSLLFDRTLDVEELRAALALPLVPSRRKLFEGRLERGEREDWKKRLEG